ncbi:hypothetical protein [Veillonella montpellierensis]|uniref:hypothetical protein n=1 Tax=Veillonella montpellierensis TaxID=187328 RepID=UPI0023F71BD0|nr:hypothetical protein [Veillonella montpellierensis]
MWRCLFINIRELVNNKAEEIYPNNDYVKERIRKELDYFENHERFGEIQALLSIKEMIKDENIYVFPTAMLSLYLLDLDFINPIPAHYYNPHIKEITFDDAASYGVDLPKKDGLNRGGFNISEDYTLNSNKDIHFEVYLKMKYLDKVKTLLEGSFDLTFELEESDKNGHKEKVFYKETTIIFNDDLFDTFFGKNLQSDINVDNFRKYLFDDAMKNLLEIEVQPKEVVSFKEMVEFLALSRVALIDKSDMLTTFIDSKYPKKFIDSKYPKTREDIFMLLRDEGYGLGEAAKLAYAITMGKKSEFEIKDQEIKAYLDAVVYAWPKAAVVSVFLRDYFSRDLYHC